ncbi:MAG TPA: hypothetical protein VN673_07520 [Clostridia bacterium]|nr:hypothetical protein [Clostridia bacterium]
MSSTIGVLLISRPLIAHLRERFGGITSAAWNAMTPEVGSPPEGLVRLSLFPYDDSRFGYAILNTLDKAYQGTGGYLHEGDAVFRLLSFYCPLFTSGSFRFDDSGGTARAIGPVLAPERCRYILEHWISVDTAVIEEQLNHQPIFFDLAERPHAGFRNAKGLLDLLGRYASFLDQAVSCDSFYFSYDGNSL